MQNSRKIEINVKQIAAYKAVILGYGSIMSLTEQIDGCEFVIVDESVAQINDLIINIIGRQNDNSIQNVS